MENFAATHLAITAQPTTVTAGAGFVLTVAVEDLAGDLATGYSGSVTLALTSNPGNSTLGGNVTVAVANGLAVFSGLTLNKSGQAYMFTATSSTLTSAVTGDFNVIAGAATQLIVAQAFPTNVTVDAPFGFSVLAEDAEGNVATSFSNSVEILLAANPGNSTLTGNANVSANNGVAVFSGLKLNNLASGYELSASGGGLSVTLGPFNVTALGVATHLVVETSPPLSLAPGAAFGVTVEAEDDFGTVDPSFNGSVTISPGEQPRQRPRWRARSRASASAGVATFTGLSLNNPGAGYTLQATSGGLTAGKTNLLQRRRHAHHQRHVGEQRRSDHVHRRHGFSGRHQRRALRRPIRPRRPRRSSTTGPRARSRNSSSPINFNTLHGDAVV